MTANNFDNIPDELRAYSQWIVWRSENDENGKPTKVPYSVSGHRASVTDSRHWTNFDLAVKTALNGGSYSGIGFVLTDADPFAFIDLDDPYALNPDGSPKHPKPETILEKQKRIFEAFPSYAERSPSGKGLHIIVKGHVPCGRRRDSVEVYSNERYMTVTGDVYRPAPIVPAEDTLQSLWLEMSKDTNNLADCYAGTTKEFETDQQIIQRAMNAANGEKFKALYGGKWQGHYPSQSEADFALVDMLAFYTKNKQQIKRIFGFSALGERNKKTTIKGVPYLDHIVNRAFDKTPMPINFDSVVNNIAEVVAESKRKQVAKKEPASVTTSKAYTVPPGLLGEIAQFIYAAAPRPVPEIALVGAIGLMCGIVGRSYNVSGTGLNQYVLLLAPTGTGKEAIASGIEKLMKAIERTVPASSDFIGPAEIASSPALIKYLSRTPCFVSVLGEFGLTLQEMSMPRAPGHLVGLKRLMLDLYNKSGEGGQLRPRIYSDKEKNTDTVSSPSFSLVGESTPLRFYQALSEDMIEEGLLPRFLTIEYTGLRPSLNEERANNPPIHLVDQLGALCTHSLMLNSQHKSIDVRADERAMALFKDFDRACDDKMNSSQSEVTKQLWNRAHIKAMKLAALVAIGNNTYDPMIDERTAIWAINIETAGVQNILSRFESGQVGQRSLSETAQHTKVRNVVREWITRPWRELARYNVGSEGMSKTGVVPYSYISKRLTNDAAFKDSKPNATATIKRSIDELCKGGELMKVERQDASKKFNTTAELYAVTDAKRIMNEGQTSDRAADASDS